MGQSLCQQAAHRLHFLRRAAVGHRQIIPFVAAAAVRRQLHQFQHDLLTNTVSYKHLQAKETDSYIVSRLLLDKTKSPKPTYDTTTKPHTKQTIIINNYYVAPTRPH